MHQRKYFNSNFFINEIFSVEKFPNYGMPSVIVFNVLYGETATYCLEVF